jgi:hypothetical protein
MRTAKPARQLRDDCPFQNASDAAAQNNSIGISVPAIWPWPKTRGMSSRLAAATAPTHRP